MWIVFSVQFNVCVCVRVNYVCSSMGAMFDEQPHIGDKFNDFVCVCLRTSSNDCWMRRHSAHCISLYGCGTDSIHMGTLCPHIALSSHSHCLVHSVAHEYQTLTHYCLDSAFFFLVLSFWIVPHIFYISTKYLFMCRRIELAFTTGDDHAAYFDDRPISFFLSLFSFVISYVHWFLIRSCFFFFLLLLLLSILLSCIYARFL